MNKLEKLGTVESILLIITIFANQIIFNTPNIILLATGSSAWINIIYVSIIAIVFVYIICKIFKKFPQEDILDISKFLGGNVLKTIIGIIYIIFFFIFNIAPICYFANAIKLIYFKNTPIILLVTLFLIPAIIINFYGLKSISSVIAIFTPLVLVSIFILLFGASKYFVIQNIFPLFGFGVKQTFLYGLTNLFAFSGIAYLFFLNPLLKESKDLTKISIITMIIAFIYLFLSIISLLLSFYCITMNDQLLSLYLLTRVLEFGAFLQRVDAIFIFIWILNTFCFSSLTLFYIITIFKKLTNIENPKALIFSISALFFSGALAFTNITDIKHFARLFYKYFAVALVFVVSFLIMILASYKLKKQKKETHN